MCAATYCQEEDQDPPAPHAVPVCQQCQPVLQQVLAVQAAGTPVLLMDLLSETAVSLINTWETRHSLGK